MITISRLFLLSATALCLSGVAHAQAVDAPVRNSVNIGQDGYATLNTPTTRGEQEFKEKAKVVAEAKLKREAKQQRDQRALPGLTATGAKKASGPPV